MTAKVPVLSDIGNFMGSNFLKSTAFLNNISRTMNDYQHNFYDNFKVQELNLVTKIFTK